MNVKIATVGLAHPFEVGFDNAENLLSATVKALKKENAECVNAGVIMHDLTTVEKAAEILKKEDFDVLLICIATWSEDHHLLDLLSYIDKPVILRAYPAFDTGSLCCAHQIGAVFTDIGKKYEFVYGDADDAAAARKTVKIALPYALADSMSKAKVGAVGGRVQGMTEIAYDEFAIKEKLGARVINIDEKEMTEKVKAISDEQAQAVLDAKKPLLRGCAVTSSQKDMLESVKYYIALKALCDAYALSAISVKCYTTYMGKVCLAYSLLAEEGIVASCEGDVTNALTMQMVFELSGRPVNNTDLLYLNDEKNTILFAHCGSSGFSIAGGEIELAPVRLAETGVCCKFVMAPGKVTAVNICGHGDTFRLSYMVGEAIPCGMEFPGNPVVIRFEKPVEQINEEIMKYGIGHHWMVAYGDLGADLERFCKIRNIRCYGI